METQQTGRQYHILILGAAGGIGRQCVDIALAKGHHVTAVLRNPAKLTIVHQHLRIVKGDITDPATFSKDLENVDAVISAIGVSGGLGSDKPTTLYSQGNANLLQAMKKAGVEFFVCGQYLAGEKIEHVVEEADAGLDLGAAGAVEVHPDRDLGFLRRASDFAFAHRSILGRAFSSSNEKPAPPPLADKSGYGLRSKKQPLNKGGGSCP